MVWSTSRSSTQAAAELAAELDTAGRIVLGVNAEEESAEAFTSAWRHRTGDHGAAADERLSYGGMIVWKVDGTPASIAGITRAVAGMVRVGPVYTPPALRQRGYAGAVTAAVSQAALDAGVREVVLYTDLANPTSNASYQRLGYRPVEDRVLMSFAPAT
jgi:predicted GNAT family acetyltransferase